MTADDLLQELLPRDGSGHRRLYSRAAAPYSLVSMRGPDAGDFLHRLCSQDVLSMDGHDVRPAAFLDAKGRLLATCLVLRQGGDYWLEVPEALADRLAALLERYHFTEKVTIARIESHCVEGIGGDGAASLRQVLEAGESGISFAFGRRGVSFRRAHTLGPATGAAPAEADLSPELAECFRLLAGFVRVGVETEATTLALEVDLDDHVSTTKGCYTGQEIVARIHTYGHTNRKLCLLLLGPGTPITAPQPVHELEDQLAVGRVMHAVPIPGREQRLGVGFLPKDFQAIGQRLALADGGTVEVIGYEPLAGLPA